jgi:hypothetical protein
MIPFEEEASLTKTEEVVESMLESNWDNVIRTSPAVLKDFEEKYPKACDLVSQKIANQGVEKIGDLFRPGVPDFLAFDDNGDYLFVEVKGEKDGLRHTQLKWIKDFKEANCQIWFTDSNESVQEKMSSDKLDSYSFKEASKDRGETEVRPGENSFVNIQLPKTLAAIMDMEKGDRVSWSIKNRSKLLLDTD